MDQYQQTKEKFVEGRIDQEVSERPERVLRLKQKIESLFVGEELRDLRESIFQSLQVPQCGEYHNEGVYMDTHLDLILDNIKSALEGKVSDQLLEEDQILIVNIVKKHAHELEHYAFLHDIAKKDCLTIKKVSGTNGEIVEQKMTWDEWQAELPSELRDNPDPKKLLAYFKIAGIKSVSYYQKSDKNKAGRMHGKVGADQVREFNYSGVSESLLTAIELHEVAFLFTEISCKRYEKNFGEMNEEQRDLAVVASYLDAVSSLSDEGKPNLTNFKYLVDSKHNYELILSLRNSADLSMWEDVGLLDNVKVKRFLDHLYESDQRILLSTSEIVEKIKNECTPDSYNPEIFENKLAALVTTGVISSEQQKRLVRFVSIGKLKAIGDEMGEELGRNMRLANEALESSKEKTKFLDPRDFSPVENSAIFLDTFSNLNSKDKLAALDKLGILDKLLPEYARNKNLTQDPRYHGSETVGEHLLATVAMMNDKIASSAPFSDPNFEKLLGIAAFFHDIGKNEDEDKAPKKVGKEGLGYRVVTKKKDDDFERIRFAGHQAQGEKIFKERIAQIQNGLPEDKQLSSEEILMVSLWIRNHMRGINAVRDLERFTPEELAEQIIKDAYPLELLNARIPLVDVIRATIMMQEVELLSIPDSDKKQKMADAWELVKSKVESLLPILEEKNKKELMISLIKGDDLIALGIIKKERQPLLDILNQKQLIGEIVDRRGALLTLISLATESGIEVDESKVDELVGKGAFSELRARKEHLKVVEEDRREGYILKRYETTPVRQFTKDTPVEVLEQMVNSGNFPNLAAHIQQYKIPIKRIKDLVLKNGFANLLQLEFFVKEYCNENETLLDVSRVHSPTTRAVEIARKMPDGNEATIIVNNGYQSSKDHIGAGLIHIGEQRLEALKKSYKKTDESDDEMVKRFFEEAVINVTGSASVEIPSDYDPKKYSILVSAIKNSGNKQFAGIVIQKFDKYTEVITALFQESPKRLRADLRSMLRRLREKSGFTDEQLEKPLADANELLKIAGEEPLQLDQLVQVQPSGGKGEKNPKEAVVIPDVLKKLKSSLEEKLIGVAEIYPKLVMFKNKKQIFDGIVDGTLRKKLGLTEEQIQLILATLEEK